MSFINNYSNPTLPESMTLPLARSSMFTSKDKDIQEINRIIERSEDLVTNAKNYKEWSERKIRLEQENSEPILKKITRVSLNILGFIGLMLLTPFLPVLVAFEIDGDCHGAAAFCLIYNRKNPLSQGSLVGIINRRFGISTVHATEVADRKINKYKASLDLSLNNLNQEIEQVEVSLAKHSIKMQEAENEKSLSSKIQDFIIQESTMDWLNWAKEIQKIQP